jgi:hypothetical protein
VLYDDMLNECWSLFINNVLINLCYLSKSGFGCDIEQMAQSFLKVLAPQSQ